MCFPIAGARQRKCYIRMVSRVTVLCYSLWVLQQIIDISLGTVL